MLLQQRSDTQIESLKNSEMHLKIQLCISTLFNNQIVVS